MIEMSVRHNDSFCISDDQLEETSDEEREVHFHKELIIKLWLQQRTIHEIMICQRKKFAHQYKEVKGCSPGNSDVQDKEPTAKIRRIDIQVRQKMKELHNLMRKDRFDKSPQMLQQCMVVYQPSKRLAGSDAGEGVTE